MAKKSGTDWVKISGYLFLVGVLVAVVSAFYNFVYSETILLVIGTIVGLLAIMGLGSISKEDSESFLLATVAFAVVGAFGKGITDLPVVGQYLGPILINIGIMIAPAVILIAIEAIWRAGSIKY